MEQEVAVEPVHRAQVRRVTGCAADGLEHHVPPRGKSAIARRSLYRRGESSDEVCQQLALVLIHVELELGRIEFPDGFQARLVLPGHFESELIRARSPDKIVETRNLTLPAEPANPAVG